jgi:hypothetical protein
MNKKPLVHITHAVPIMAYQGLSVRINNDGSLDLLFYQTTEESPEQIEVDTVASIRLPDEARWQEIRDLIEDQLEKFKTREP